MVGHRPRPLGFVPVEPPTWLIHPCRDVSVRPYSDGLLGNYRSLTRHHLLPFFGARRADEITPAPGGGVHRAKLGATGSTRFPGRPLTRSSLRLGLVALRLILQRAVTLGYLTSNPVVGLGRFARVDEEHIDPFTTAELQSVVATAHRLVPDFAALLPVWAQTGMRAGEVCGLQWQDLDLERGVVWFAHLDPWPPRGRPRPAKPAPSRWPTQSWTSRPSGRVAARGGRDRLGGRRGPLAPPGALARPRGLRLRPRGGPPAGPCAPHDLAKGPDHGGSPPPGRGQLRHHFASTMLSRNAPLLYVQKQGGWRSAAVLLRVYARWLPDTVTARLAATPAQPMPMAAGAEGWNTSETMAARAPGETSRSTWPPRACSEIRHVTDSGPKSLPRQDNHGRSHGCADREFHVRLAEGRCSRASESERRRLSRLRLYAIQPVPGPSLRMGHGENPDLRCRGP